MLRTLLWYLQEHFISTYLSTFCDLGRKLWNRVGAEVLSWVSHMKCGTGSSKDCGRRSEPWRCLPFPLLWGEGVGLSGGHLLHVSAPLLLIISETRKKKEGRVKDREGT